MVILLTVGIWLWWSNRRYELTDFDSIVIGESTRDGNWIVVRYYGPDHIVWKIEIMSEPG